VAVSTLKPEPIPLQVKVILVGNEFLHQLLYEYDEDFKKLFKIKVDFDEEMDRNEDNTLKLAQFISSFCRRENARILTGPGWQRWLSTVRAWSAIRTSFPPGLMILLRYFVNLRHGSNRRKQSGQSGACK